MKMEATKKEDENSSLKMQIFAAIVCSLLTFMYGNSVGWSSTAVPQIEAGILSDGPIKAETSGWIGGAFCLGALFSSPFHGPLADAKGRKFAACIVATSFAINWIILLSTDYFAWVMVARVFAGLAGSGAITVVSIYNNEIAELKIKSATGGLLALFYALGIEFAYIMGAFLPYKTITIVYLCICLGWFLIWWKMPETPAHLLLHGQTEKCLSSVRWLRGVDDAAADRIMTQIKNEQAGALTSATFKKFYPAARKAIILASLLISFQTFSGSMAISAYAANTFSKTGGSLTVENGVMIFGVFLIVGGLIPPVIADKAPRKVLLCVSTFLMGCGLAAFGTIQLFKSRLDPIEEENYASIMPAVILSLTIFAYYFGLGSLPFMNATELFTDENRGIAGAIVSIVIWLTTFVVLQFYGQSVEVFGDYTVFYFFACMVFMCFAFVIVCLPETKGKSIQEIRNMLLNIKK